MLEMGGETGIPVTLAAKGEGWPVSPAGSIWPRESHRKRRLESGEPGEGTGLTAY